MLDIIFENNDFVVVDKPEEISFHNDDQKELGLFNQLKAQLQIPLYSVHRLDRVTSGVILFAKSSEVASLLGKLFSEHQVEKYYLALAGSHPKKKQGMIKGDMAKARRGSWKLLKEINNPAVTQFFSYSFLPGKRLYILKPHTGKTHQLRVALKSVGAPIIGDSLYAGELADRTYLHAYQLSFALDGEVFTFRSPPKTGEFFVMSEFQERLNEIGELTQLSWPKVV